MPTERTINRPVDHVTFLVKVNGLEVSSELHLVALSVTKSVNKISSAKLVYLDGVPAEEDFPLSNEDLFIPGNEIELFVGGVSDPVSVFKGVVVKHSIRVRNSSSPQLLIECKHKATKLTYGRKSAYFYDQKDSDILSGIFSQNGLSPADVEETEVAHKEMVQYDATDWDFVLLRAEANGKFIYTNNEGVQVKKPDFAAEPALTLLYGATIFELDAELDSRQQYGEVNAFTWDPAGEEVTEAAGSVPGFAEQGNLTTSTLASDAGVESYRLQHGARLSTPELKSWADGCLLQSKLAKIKGTVKADGLTSINPGDMLELQGAGDRFNGKVFVSGVRQDFDLAFGWKTTIQFGLEPEWLFPQRPEPRKAGGLLPGLNGLHIGVVVSNEDPDGMERVQVKMPLISNDQVGIWARLASLDAGADRGMVFRPELGDEVVVGFINDDPRHPVILGMLHSSAKPAPISGADDNHEKGYTSRSQMKWQFNDDKKIISIETPAGNKLIFSEEDAVIKLEDQHGNLLEMNSAGIKLESIAAIELKATTDLKAAAVNAEIKASANVKLEGSGGLEAKSSGIAKLQGSLVQIN